MPRPLIRNAAASSRSYSLADGGGPPPIGRGAAKDLIPAAVLLLWTALAAAPALAAIVGTPHDMTAVTGDLFAGPCVYCHIPHQAQGERLWTSTPYGPSTGWGSRNIAQLCYTCHDSTGGGFNARNATITAYNELSHGYEVANLPLHPDGLTVSTPYLPYYESGLMDCTTCHDPHTRNVPFLRGTGGIDALCRYCHARDNPGLVAAGNVYGTETSKSSYHPTDIEYADIPANGPTGLEPLPDLFQVATASGNWLLGGHLVGWEAGKGAMSCQTCHPVHGGHDYLMGIMPGPPASSLTPIENTGGSYSALCQSCHKGGEEGETVGEGTDHPINTNDGDPVTVFPQGWPSGVASEVTCSSCHDVHGGEPATSLLRKGGDTVNGWCFSCHSVENLTPPYHHSCRENDDPAVFTSVITCGDCHGQGAGWKAHNGFGGFKVAVGPTGSDLCAICHDPADPPFLDEGAYYRATSLSIDFSSAAQPALHGRASGKESHVINHADDDSIFNCQTKTTVWDRTGGASKYGPGNEIICESCHNLLTNAGVVLGSGPEELMTGGWKTNLLLEPYEDNSPGTGVESPDWIPGPTLSDLCRGCHYSDRPGTPTGFVHNPMPHTQFDYVYTPDSVPYGRTTLNIMTTPIDSRGPSCPEVSSADQMSPPSGLGPGAPGAFSYPAPNTIDCDSCHRPHGADNDSADDGKHRILEYDAPASHGTTPCLECHNPDSQCGFGSPSPTP